MLNRISFIYKIAGIQIIILGLVIMTGLFAYAKFTGVIQGITEKLAPSSRLVKAHELLNHLNEAEINAKSYSLTRDTMYLDQFYFATSHIESDLDELHQIEEDDSLDTETSEVLYIIIQEKLDVLQDLISLQDKFRAAQALERVSDKIESEIATHAEKDSIIESESKFGWLFNKRKEKNTLPDSVFIQSFDKIALAVDQAQIKESKMEIELKDKELQLILADELLNAEIALRLDNIRKEELEQVAAETKFAEHTIAETKVRIAWFCFFIVVLIVFMAIVIMNYVRANARYRTALREAKKNAEDLANAKQHFLANVSHEIRTPINAIAGFTEQLSKSNLTPEQLEQIEIIHKSADHLSHLLNDLLDFSKLEADKLSFETIPFNPATVIREVVDLISAPASKKNLSLPLSIDTDIPKSLMGDPYRLKQILLNLYSNAIKFTEKGCIGLRVKVVLSSEKDVHLQLSIKDSGIGMSPDQLSKIFLEFEQAHEGITRKFGGTGLGLTIVRMLVDKQGGKLKMESEVGVGTKVTVEIPYGIVESPSIHENIKTQESTKIHEFKSILTDKRILIVDDEAYNRKLLAVILKKHHAIFTETADGREAIRELERNDYDLILMDARMPYLSGPETTREIRKMSDPRKANIPILAISAAHSLQDRKLYLESGMDGSIQKPFKEAHLVEEISRVTGKSAGFGSPVQSEKKTDPKDLIQFGDLQAMCDGDKEFYADMLRTFISGTTDGVKKISDAYVLGDFDRLTSQAHKIAAPCNHIGAHHLYETLKKIEFFNHKHESVSHLEELVIRLQKEAAQVLELVQKELEENTAS